MLKGKELDNFIIKVKNAQHQFNDIGLYTCPVCDGNNTVCEDDYQSLECEYLEREMLGDKYYDV